MNLSKYEIVNRPATHFVFVEKNGPFKKVAPQAWQEMFPLVHQQLDPSQFKELLGLSGMDNTKQGEMAMVYEAGVALPSEPPKKLNGLRYKKIGDGKYARFLLTGSYDQIGQAFEQIFKTLKDKGVEIRPEFCIENYLNDPKETPEDQLQTELLIPVV